jgi:hypothetical protein
MRDTAPRCLERASALAPEVEAGGGGMEGNNVDFTVHTATGTLPKRHAGPCEFTFHRFVARLRLLASEKPSR